MSKSHEICGVWRNFSIQIVQDSDIPLILDHLVSNFYLDEAIIQRLQRDAEFIANSNEKIQEKLKQNPSLSIIAIDLKTRDIAGVQLVFIWKKEEAEAEKMLIGKNLHSDPNSKSYTRKVRNAIYAPIKTVQLGLFDRYEVDEIAWNFVSCTGRKYRGQGLASELYLRMNNRLKSLGVKFVYSIFTSPFSRRCAEKCEFIEIARSYFGEASDEDGELVLPEARGPEDFAALMVLKL